MFDVVTFGSGTQDIFVQSKNYSFIKSDKFVSGKGLCVGAGSKFYVDKMFLTIGGCGVNTGMTFARQGLKTAYLGKIGQDLAGQQIIDELKKAGVDTSLIVKTNKLITSHSIILTAPQAQRTILIYRGASNSLKESEVPFAKLATKWFYVAPMSGQCGPLFEPLLKFAQEKDIQVSTNLGKTQIKMGLDVLRPLLNLPMVKIVNMNQEEAALLTGLDFKKEKEIFKVLDEVVKGIVIMTKGPEGVTVSDGQYLYQAGTPKSGYIDRTGAGDAFGSGFTTAIIKGQTIAQAIQLATANATSCVQKFGTTHGLLKKDEFGPWPKVEVKKEKI